MPNTSQEYNYSSLCTRINQACAIDGNYILTDTFRRDILNLQPPKNGYYIDSSGANGIPAFMFGKVVQLTNSTPTGTDYEDDEDDVPGHGSTIIPVDVETPVRQTITYVPVLRMRYALNTSVPLMRQLAADWEREALRYLTEEYRSNLITILPSSAAAINESVTKNAHAEGLFLGIVMLIFLILVCGFLSVEGNLHTSVGCLPFCGIISIALSTGASFGLLTVFRIQIVEPLALLAFILASKFVIL